MVATSDTSYTDAKGRTRWQRNDWLAERLKELGEFLIIGGYEESHAVVYKRLSYTISRYPASVERLLSEGRLAEIPDVGPTIAALIEEFMLTGTCGKREEWATCHPPSLLDVCAIPGMGAKMVRTLYLEHRIDSLPRLEKALDSGQLAGVRGLGKKTVESARAHIAAQAGTS